MHTKLLLSFIALVLFFTLVVFVIFRNQANFQVQTFDTIPTDYPAALIQPKPPIKTTSTTPEKNTSPKVIQTVQIGGKAISVELVTTQAEQNKGLGGRTGLSADTGMLFIFDHPDRYAFWMKDMNFPIDIIWISEDLHVIYIKKDAKPELYPETYGPSMNAKYVLEVPSGFSDANNVKEGDSILFTY